MRPQVVVETDYDFRNSTWVTAGDVDVISVDWTQFGDALTQDDLEALYSVRRNAERIQDQVIRSRILSRMNREIEQIERDFKMAENLHSESKKRILAAIDILREERVEGISKLKFPD